MSAARHIRFACMTGILAALLAPALAVGEAYDPLYPRLVYEPAHDRAVPNAGGTEREITTRSVEYARFNGRSATGYMARPANAGGASPALLVIHEQWGLNDDIRAMTRRLAANGYTALAVDLYNGQTAATPERARALMQQATDNAQRLRRNLREGALYLDLMPSTARVGSIGWCFGGGWSLRTALMLPEIIDAAVVYDGELITESAPLESLAAPVLGHFGRADASIPPERVREFDTLLDELDKPHEIYLYDGADHAFASPSGTQYAAEPVQQAWERTVDFLEQVLQTQGNPPEEDQQREDEGTEPDSPTQETEVAGG